MTDDTKTPPTTDARADENARKIAEFAARNPKLLAFARWTMGDPATRSPKTQQEWARENGVAESTLSRWKRDPLFTSILKGWKDEMRPLTANIAAALYKAAVNGDVKAIRAWMELMGEFPKQQLEMSFAPPDLTSILRGTATPDEMRVFEAWLTTQATVAKERPQAEWRRRGWTG